MRLVVLGSTGSVGKATLEIIRDLGPPFRVVGLAIHSQIDLLEKQVKELGVKDVSIYDEKAAIEFKKRNRELVVSWGDRGLEEIATLDEADAIVIATSGIASLKPALSAIEKKKRILLANKEILVSGGPLLVKKAREQGVPLIPLDSEHSALFQCLQGHENAAIHRLILTASGGPFLRSEIDDLKAVTPEKALKHPTWKMGPKVTIDSSTLMNKGLEIIEASYLFNLPPEKLEVVIHPQSLVQSFVEFVDGALLAEIHVPDMRVPIQYGLTYPKRQKTRMTPFDFTKHGHFDFYEPDRKKFRSLDLSYHALKEGGSFPCYINSANEELVLRFMNREISWLSIIEKLETLLNKHQKIKCSSLDEVLSIDRQARDEAKII